MGRSRYQSVAAIATGGMGTVELAVRLDDGFRRVFALKRLHPHLRADPAFVAMFREEARLSALLRHPNVVTVVDFGEDERGLFLAMEYIEGLSVAETLAALADAEQLPLPMGLLVAAQAARGLHAAHELADHRGQPLGLVHRDVSTKNILIGFDGLARVTDFGIAKARGSLARTSTGLIKGSVGYLSPEALRFAPLDRRADLFSLGVVLYEMLTGRRLYDGDDAPAVARRILDEPPPDVLSARPDTPPALVELLFEMLAKDPAHRPRDAEIVARRLEEILHELTLVGGAFDVAGYMAAAFGPERARRAETVTTALTTVLGDPGAAARPDATIARRRRRRVRLSAGLALMAAASGAFAWRAAVPRHGLRGEYFKDRDLRALALSRIDREVAFDWGTAPPDRSVPQQGFSVRWTGSISAPVAGKAQLCLASDDGVRLWFDGALVIDSWTVQWLKQSCAPVVFEARTRHALRIDYMQNTGMAYVRLFWILEGEREYRSVPSQFLHPP